MNAHVNPALLGAAPLMTVDAAQANVGFVRSQTAVVETGVYRMRFPEIRYPGPIPVDYSAPDWIQSVEYYSMDVAGSAKWSADRAGDINVVGTEMERHTTRVHMADIGYDYGLEEVNVARMLGMNLPNEKAIAARMIYERTIDRIAFDGDTEKGWQGLYNTTGVPVAAAVTGDWSTATEDQILADINAAITGVYTATNEVAMADTVGIPNQELQRIASRRLGDGNGAMTVLQFIQTANAYTAMTGRPLTIRGMRGLATAGAGSTQRMVAYRNSPEVLKMHVPMPFQFLPVQLIGLKYVVPGIFRTGKLTVRLPNEIRYVDGI